MGRPFDTAMVKFQNSAHLNVAIEKLKYFKTQSGHLIRFLPFDQNLYKGSNEPYPEKLPTVIVDEADKENQCEDNLPDNSN